MLCLKLNIELIPSKFRDTQLTNISDAYKRNVYRKRTNLLSLRTSKTPKQDGEEIFMFSPVFL